MPDAPKIVAHAPRDHPSSGQKARQVWTPEEDRKLSEAVAKETPKHGPVSWHKVAAHLPGRNNKDCRKRWHYSIANTIRKGTWMREEDERLREAVELYGTRWSKIADAVGTRNGDQCWKRWYDCLDPRIDKSPWTADEDARLLELVSKNGRNWSDIVHRHFPNRTSLSAKNRYSILRRKQACAASRTDAAAPSRSSVYPRRDQVAPPTPSPSHATPEPDSIPRWMGFSEVEIDELLQQSFQIGATESWYAASDASASPSPYMGCDLDWTGMSPSPATTAPTSWASPSPLAVDSNLLAPPPNPMAAAAAYYPQPQPPAALTAGCAGMDYNALGIYRASAGYAVQVSDGAVFGSASPADGGLTVQSTLGDWQSAGYGVGW